jgi:hypothetical protein
MDMDKGHRQQTCHKSCSKELILKHSGDNVPPCNFHAILAKDMNFEPKVGHYENLNVLLPWDKMRKGGSP